MINEFTMIHKPGPMINHPEILTLVSHYFQLTHYLQNASVFPHHSTTHCEQIRMGKSTLQKPF
jgi:hypothetical protein